MLDGLKALITVEKLGTVCEAAVELRLTQSAVSKRIQALESEIGHRLVEKEGRRLRLTGAGIELLAKAKPLLSQIESLRLIGKGTGVRELSIGVADSIASSWGPSALRRAVERLPGLKLEIHVHRSTLILENIRLGRYELGLVTSQDSLAGLVCSPIATEEMVLIEARKRGRGASGFPILTIETASATWREIGSVISKHPQLHGRRFEFVESFAAAAQMAREGFAPALVPLGVARALGFRRSELAGLSPKVERPIQLVTRKSVYELEVVQKLSQELSRIGAGFGGASG